MLELLFKTHVIPIRSYEDIKVSFPPRTEAEGKIYSVILSSRVQAPIIFRFSIFKSHT